MKRSRGRSSKKKKKVFHRDWLKNFSSSRLVSFELFTIRSNWPRAMPINVIYQRCNLLRGTFSIVWVNSFHRRSRGRLQKKRITTEVNKKRRERETGWKFSALLPGGGSASLPVNDGSIVVSDNFYNKPVKRLLFLSLSFSFLSPFLFAGFYFSPSFLTSPFFSLFTRQTLYWLFRFRFVMNKDHIQVNSAVYGDDSCCSSEEVSDFFISAVNSGESLVVNENSLFSSRRNKL